MKKNENMFIIFTTLIITIIIASFHFIMLMLFSTITHDMAVDWFLFYLVVFVVTSLLIIGVNSLENRLTDRKRTKRYLITKSELYLIKENCKYEYCNETKVFETNSFRKAMRVVRQLYEIERSTKVFYDKISVYDQLDPNFVYTLEMR